MDITLGFTGLLHTLASSYALLAGAAVLWRAKGGSAHQLLGKHYVGAALLANITALFIYRLGGFNFFHVLALLTLTCLGVAFAAARKQWPRKHWLRVHLTAIVISYYLMLGGLVNEAFARLPFLRGEYGLRALVHSSVMIFFLMVIAYFWGRTAKPVAAALLLAATSASAARLDVDVRGAAPGKGAIHIALYDSKDSFLHTAARKLVVQPGERASFDSLAPGRYAISLFQDENGNGILDRKMFGIPAEPYGFSNDAKGSFGPPTFEAAGIDLPAEGRQIAVTVRN